MAILCKEHKILYIQVPGTGCSVVGRILQEHFGGEKLGRKHNDVSEILEKELLGKVELGEYLTVANIRNPYDRMVTYYQRLRGGWTQNYLDWARRNLERRRKKGEITEEEYVQGLAELPQAEDRQKRRMRIVQRVGFNPWLDVTLLRWRARDRGRTPDVHGLRFEDHLFPMLSGVDVALRQEQLQDALNAMLRQVGVQEHVPLPQKNVTPGKKPYTDYYNPISRVLMERLYRAELSFFGYRFDGATTTDPLVQLTSSPAVHRPIA